MNNIENFINKKLEINEKLIINKNIKINNNSYNDHLTDKDCDKILNELCKYFQQRGTFGGNEYDNKLQIVDKFFHKDISEYFRRLFLWEDMAEYIGIDKDDFKNYIKDNKEEIYEQIKDFVL